MPTSLMTFRRARTGAALLLVAGALSVSACKSGAPKVLPPEPSPATTTTTTTSESSSSLNTPAAGSQADFTTRMMGSDTIYFDTDKSDIDANDQSALAKQAQWLAQYPGKRATIEGHCDERGTREYNLALGERRANAAKNFLVSLGVDASRLTIVSYGKERPVALGSDEASWAQNRRAVTVTVD